MRVVSVKSVTSSNEALYDITVRGNHNYLVTESDVVVHNCGVGFEPVPGALSGFAKPLTVEVARSKITLDEWESGFRGRETNREYYEGDSWVIEIGDSAEAWAKAIGKLMAGKKRVKTLVIDLSQIRPGGIRLKGYGWISSGDVTFAAAIENIANILNRRSDQLLTRIDILDILNHMGTTLSSRRSAESAIVPFNDPEWEEFALAKKDSWKTGNIQRAQSNNSLIFFQRPTKLELRAIFDMIKEGGGSEPGFVNGEHAKRRAPWYSGHNPCFEIALSNKGLCNLCTTDLSKFNGKLNELHRAIHIIARANYRQTCVNLDDGILQRTWHESNEFLRLTGVSITGFVGWEHQKDAERLRALRDVAQKGADSMADDLELPRSKGVTTQKPEGTASKIMDTTEGCHRPMGKYIFNKVRFSIHDPIVEGMKSANYEVTLDPYDETNALITFPVAYENVEFTRVTLSDGREVEVNLESAVDQLERYKFIMDNYVDKHNVSNTISYSPDEIPQIINWIYENWDHYVGVSFLYRTDPTKTAADLNFPYLPQSVVTEQEYNAYVATLLPVELDGANSFDEIQQEECAGGMCPVR